MRAADSSVTDIEALYTGHHDWLRGWLRKKIGCSEQAADLAHDTFVRVLATRDARPSLQEPRAFLTTIARHLLIDRVRHRQIEESYLEQLALTVEAGAAAPSPEDILQAVRALRRLGDALAELPAKAREAFLLHYLEGMSQPEVAERLEVSLRMAQKYLAQALLRCHQALQA